MMYVDVDAGVSSRSEVLFFSKGREVEVASSQSVVEPDEGQTGSQSKACRLD